VALKIEMYSEKSLTRAGNNNICIIIFRCKAKEEIPFGTKNYFKEGGRQK
jgi:hypothetical protein